VVRDLAYTKGCCLRGMKPYLRGLDQRLRELGLEKLTVLVPSYGGIIVSGDAINPIASLGADGRDNAS